MAQFDEESEEQIEQSHKPFCPKCGSTDIRTSHSHRLLDGILRALALRPYRCRTCRKRFYMRRPADTEPEVNSEGEALEQHAAESSLNKEA